MADTIRGDFPNAVCECGAKGCIVRHWGPLVPKGAARDLCADTYRERVRYYEAHGTAMPDELVTKVDGEGASTS